MRGCNLVEDGHSIVYCALLFGLICSVAIILIVTTAQVALSQSDLSVKKPSPRLQLITPELKEGKNVLKVELSDKSAIIYSSVKYVKNGQLTLTSLTHDQGSVYKVLLDVKRPLAVVVFDLVNIDNVHIKEMKKLTVQSDSSLWDKILEWLKSITSSNALYGYKVIISSICLLPILGSPS